MTSDRGSREVPERLSEGRDRCVAVLAGTRDSVPNQCRRGDETGLVAHHHRGQQAVVDEAECEPRRGVGPPEGTAETDVSEPRQDPAQGQSVVSEMEGHRDEQTAVRVQAAPTGQLSDQFA